MQIIPKYINEKRNVIRLVLWTAFYAELFINIYQPFNSRTWIDGVTDLQYFCFATLAVLAAMLVIAFSRMIMCYYNKRHDITVVDYGIWVLVELLLMASIYTAFPMIALPSHRAELQFFSMFGDAITYTTFILLIPYAITMMAFILQDKNRTLEEYGLREARKKDKLGLEEMLNFTDERGELKLSIRPDSLFYIESADNYVKVNYLSAGRIQHFMLRNKISTIEEQFKKQELVRCHRSFIVGFSRVQVLKRTDDGLVIDFAYEGVPNIPVSKGYSQKVMERFTLEARL